jgi:hypothetical protein
MFATALAMFARALLRLQEGAWLHQQYPGSLRRRVQGDLAEGAPLCEANGVYSNTEPPGFARDQALHAEAGLSLGPGGAVWGSCFGFFSLQSIQKVPPLPAREATPTWMVRACQVRHAVA